MFTILWLWNIQLWWCNWDSLSSRMPHPTPLRWRLRDMKAVCSSASGVGKVVRWSLVCFDLCSSVLTLSLSMLSMSWKKKCKSPLFNCSFLSLYLWFSVSFVRFDILSFFLISAVPLATTCKRLNFQCKIFVQQVAHKYQGKRFRSIPH